MKNVLMEMEEYAQDKNIPIIEKDSIAFIMKYIKLNKVKKILELGSAIGYSSILMASTENDIEVTTIEKDEIRYLECLKNVKKCNLETRVNVVFQDALDVNLSGVSYDLIFIDAAKGDYIKFFEKYKFFLNPGGVIITDNLKFYGYVKNKKDIQNDKLKKVVDRIDEYIKFLKENDEFITKFYDIGDGLSISYKK